MSNALSGSTRGGTTYDLLCSGEVKSYSYNLVDLNDCQPLSLDTAINALVKQVDDTLTNIAIQQPEKELEAFTIGKSHARQKFRKKPGAYSRSLIKFDRKDPKTWKFDGGINNRWREYAQKGYSGLVALTAITRNIIPYNVRQAHEQTVDVEQYSIALEQQLIQHYMLRKGDSRLANTSFHPGNLCDQQKKPYAGIVYVAFKLRDVDDNAHWNFPEGEDNDEDDDDEDQSEDSMHPTPASSPTRYITSESPENIVEPLYDGTEKQKSVSFARDTPRSAMKSILKIKAKNGNNTYLDTPMPTQNPDKPRSSNLAIPNGPQSLHKAYSLSKTNSNQIGNIEDVNPSTIPKRSKYHEYAGDKIKYRGKIANGDTQNTSRESRLLPLLSKPTCNRKSSDLEVESEGGDVSWKPTTHYAEPCSKAKASDSKNSDISVNMMKRRCPTKRRNRGSWTVTRRVLNRELSESEKDDKTEKQSLHDRQRCPTKNRNRGSWTVTGRILNRESSEREKDDITENQSRSDDFRPDTEGTCIRLPRHDNEKGGIQKRYEDKSFERGSRFDPLEQPTMSIRSDRRARPVTYWTDKATHKWRSSSKGDGGMKPQAEKRSGVTGQQNDPREKLPHAMSQNNNHSISRNNNRIQDNTPPIFLKRNLRKARSKRSLERKAFRHSDESTKTPAKAPEARCISNNRGTFVQKRQNPEQKPDATGKRFHRVDVPQKEVTSHTQIDPDDTIAVTSSTDGDGNKNTGKTIRRYKCNFPDCSTTFAGKNGQKKLIKHENIHKKKRSRPCCYCGKTFYDEYGVKRHERTLHV